MTADQFHARIANMSTSDNVNYVSQNAFEFRHDGNENIQLFNTQEVKVAGQIQTKQLIEPLTDEDGNRVVMNRLTLDGTDVGHLPRLALDMFKAFPQDADQVPAFLHNDEFGAVAQRISVPTLLKNQTANALQKFEFTAGDDINKLFPTLGSVDQPRSPRAQELATADFKTFIYGLAAKAPLMASSNSVALRVGVFADLQKQYPGVTIQQGNPNSREGISALDAHDRASVSQLGISVPVLFSNYDETVKHVRVQLLYPDGTWVEVKQGVKALPLPEGTPVPTVEVRYQSLELDPETVTGKQSVFKSPEEKAVAKKTLENIWNLLQGVSPEQKAQVWMACYAFINTPNARAEDFASRNLQRGINIDDFITMLNAMKTQVTTLADSSSVMRDLKINNAVPAFGEIVTYHFGEVSGLMKAGFKIEDISTWLTRIVGEDAADLIATPKENKARLKDINNLGLTAENHETLIAETSALAGFGERQQTQAINDGYVTRAQVASVMNGTETSDITRSMLFQALTREFSNRLKSVKLFEAVADSVPDLSKFDVSVVQAANVKDANGALAQINMKTGQIVIAVGEHTSKDQLSPQEQMAAAVGDLLHEIVHPYVTALLKSAGVNEGDVSPLMLEAAVNRITIHILEDMNMPALARIFEKQVLKQAVAQDKGGLLMLIPLENAAQVTRKTREEIGRLHSGRVNFAILDVNDAADSKQIDGLRVISKKDLPQTKDALRIFAQQNYGVHMLGVMASSEQMRANIESAYPELVNLVLVVDMTHIIATEIKIADLIAKQA